MKNISINPIKTMVNILKRYNFIIFFTILASILIVTVIMLTNIFTQPNDTDPDSINRSQTFDQITIDKLNKFENSANNINYKSLPAGRINPFSE